MLRLLTIIIVVWNLAGVSTLMLGCAASGAADTVDRTDWILHDEIKGLRQVTLSFFYDDDYQVRTSELISNGLAGELESRGIEVLPEAETVMTIHAVGPWSGTRGLPVSSKYVKVRLAVELRRHGNEHPLMKGNFDGVVEEGSVTLWDDGYDRRLRKACGMAVGKLARALYDATTVRTSRPDSPALVLPSDLCPPRPAGQRPSLALIDFQVNDDASEGAAIAVSDIIRDYLRQTDQFRLIDRNNIRSILGEQDFARIVECDETKCLVRYGKILNAQILMHGRLTRLGDIYALYVSIVDVSTSRVVASYANPQIAVPDQLNEIGADSVSHLVRQVCAASANDRGLR